MLPGALGHILQELDTFLVDFYGVGSSGSRSETSASELALSVGATLVPSEAFLMEPAQHLGRGGEVLVHQDGGECLLGLRFGAELFDRFGSNSWTHHDLGVVAEEVSHLHALQLAAFHDACLSALDLEVLGEIDRFLVFVLGPGRTFVSGVPNPRQGCVLDAVCEMLFERRCFSQDVSATQEVAIKGLTTGAPLSGLSTEFPCAAADRACYVKAEVIAFKHIRRAYAPYWASHPMAVPTHPAARSYLRAVRSLVTEAGGSSRLALELSSPLEAGHIVWPRCS